PGLAATLLALFLYHCFVVCVSVRDLFRVRLLPYFERRLGGADTWMHGEKLLWHSRLLDETAIKHGVRPLSDFTSGDDMIHGEVLEWFVADDALRTVNYLLETSGVTNFPDGVISDLGKLQHALKDAHSKDVRFCLLLREGSSASGAEMDQRQGSFF
ncbi:hypothetical protein, partial [Pedosphaera parvula]